MANPAEDLYQIFLKWRSNTNKPHTHSIRNLKADSPEDGWADMRYATSCLNAIMHILDLMKEQGDDVTAEKEYFQEWTNSVFSYPAGWASLGHQVSDDAFNSLSMFRNSCKRFLPDLDSGAVDEIKRLLRDEPEMVPPPGSYPVELFDYFTRVREHLKYCVDNLTGAGIFDLQAAAEHYRAAVFMMANGAFVTNPGDWGRYATQWFGLHLARRFGSTVYKEAENQLAKGTIRALGRGAQLMLEAGSS